jgi:hypothetical protein
MYSSTLSPWTEQNTDSHSQPNSVRLSVSMSVPYYFFIPWVRPLLSLYGTEWRERGYGLWKLLCETLSRLISLATPHPPPPPKKPVQQAPSPSWFLFLTPTKARATGTLSLLVSFATPLLVLNKMKRFHIGCENPVLVPCFISHSEQCCRLADFVQRGPKSGRTS